MRVALAQINPTVGAIEKNLDRMLSALAEAKRGGAEYVIYPELAVTGYPPKDLLLKPEVLDRSAEAVSRIAQACGDLTAVVGYPARSEKRSGRLLWNAAAVCSQSRVVHRFTKHLLPTYDVFDESRYFEPGPKAEVFTHNGRQLGVTICEDLWNDERFFTHPLYNENPVAEQAAAGAEILFNCSASPFVLGKHAFRRELFGHTAARYARPLVYVNQVGGNDELIFDGNSCVFDSSGRLIAQAADFEEDLLIADLAPGAAESRRHTPREGIASVYAALVLGLRDYCRKCGFRSIVLGLSGGIDSAVTAALAVAAIGAPHVMGVAMPSRYSSQGSLDDAAELARRLKMRHEVIPIEPAHRAMENMLQPLFAGSAAGLAEENIQARLRGNLLMALSNKSGSLLVTTGNKSEMAVGYCTLYGDMAGGLAVISDVPKTMVYELARWMNTPGSPLMQELGAAPIPEASITKAPSAELKPDQFDQDSLPPYEQLDEIIQKYVEEHASVPQIINSTGLPADLVRKMTGLIDRAEYKRKQTPPGLKITARAFGFGRRMPIAQGFESGLS